MRTSLLTGYPHLFSVGEIRLHPHPPLHLRTHLPLLFIESMGVDVQRSRNLRVPQQPGNRGHIRPAGDHQAGGGVPQAVDVQVLGQVVLLQNQFEPPGESAGCHGQIGPMAAEDIILRGQFSALMEF